MTVTTIILKSDDPSPTLISGVTVRFFDTGGSFITSAVTDGSGEAIVDIPDDDYDLYFFKQGVSIIAGMPLRITVDAADVDVPPNTYEVTSHITALPESVDPLLCRISGTILALDGTPALGNDGGISFGFKEGSDTGVLSGNILSPQGTVRVRPDSDGYLSFDLFRGVEYRAFFYTLETLFNVEPPELQVLVPDLPGLELHNLLFPVLVDADFSASTLALVAGADDDDSIDVVLTYSDGSQNDRRTKPPLFCTVSVVSDNEDVATVVLQVDKLIVTPVAAGTANITVTRAISDSFLYDPLPSFVTETLVVTVT